jgi:hypothetical protein
MDTRHTGCWQCQRRCWRCDGKHLVFGWAVPGDAKQTWYACPVCDGKGFLMVPTDEHVPDEPPDVALRRLTEEFLSSLGTRVDITDQLATEEPEP